MKRADLEKRAQRDKFGSGKHGFQGGNPATGQLPTIPGAEWFDHVQEEIAGVIEGAGLTVNPQHYNQLLQAIRGLMAAGAVPYTGATKHVDLNGKNLTNAGEVKLGDGRNNGYQQMVMGNYERSPGKGNYGGVLNGQFAGGSVRWMSLSNFGEDGNHVSSLWADATKAYVRLGNTNHELATKGNTIAHYGITDAASKAEVAALVTGNLADQGWTKLPNGLILQWGKTPSVFDWGEAQIHFPIAFPSGVLSIQLTEKEMNTINAAANHLAALNVTNQSFKFKMNSMQSVYTSAYWLAVGY